MFTYYASSNYVARFSLEEQQLYGSSRLGIKKVNEELFSEEFTGTLGADIWDYTGAMVGQNNALQPGDRGDQIRGDVRYELTDHLGNVRSVITDRKLPIQNGGGVDYAPDVVSAQDYYPFGMLMPGRRYANTSFTGVGYCFGFNGMERDDQMKLDGNGYNTTFRQYDPRLGKWLSADPILFAGFSSYCSMNNNPINGTDRLGLFFGRFSLNAAKWHAHRERRSLKEDGFENVGRVKSYEQDDYRYYSVGAVVLEEETFNGRVYSTATIVGGSWRSKNRIRSEIISIGEAKYDAHVDLSGEVGIIENMKDAGRVGYGVSALTLDLFNLKAGSRGDISGGGLYNTQNYTEKTYVGKGGRFFGKFFKVQNESLAGDVAVSSTYDVVVSKNMYGMYGTTDKYEVQAKRGAPGVKVEGKYSPLNYTFQLDAGVQEDWGRAQGLWFKSLVGAGLTINLEVTGELDVRLNFVEDWLEYE